jgi:hypothetical protein
MSDQGDRRSAFEAALGSEYFALQGIRASSIAEAGTRASLFFTTLTGTVLALGFLAGSTDAVAPVAYAAMPIVVLLGVMSYFRLVEISIEDVQALQAIQRIRGYYGGLVPEAAEFFPAPGSQQAIDQLLDTGVHRSAWRATLTIASTVGAVVSLVAGAAVAFALGDMGLNTAIAAVVAAVVAVAVGYGLFRYQEHRFMTAMGETRGGSRRQRKLGA